MRLLKQILPFCCLFIFCFSSAYAQKAGMKIQKSSLNEEIPISTESNEARAELEKALFYFDMFDQKNTQKHAKLAIEKDPNLALAYMAAAFGSNNSAEFSKNMNKAKELSANVSPAEKHLIDIGYSFLSGNAEARLAAAKELVSVAPNSARSWVMLGNAYEGMQETTQARAAFNKAIEKAPQWIGGYVSLSNNLVFQQPTDFYAAIENAKKASSLAPESAYAHILLGDAYRADNNLQKAAKQYEKASEVEPDNSVALIKLGHANSFLGNYDEARKNYQDAAKASTSPMMAANYEAYTHLYEGQPDQAISGLENNMKNMESMGLPAEQQDNDKMSGINSISWIAFHLGNAEMLEKMNEMRSPVAEKIRAAVNNDEAQNFMEAEQHFWASLANSLRGNYQEANQEAEMMKSSLEPIKSPNKLEDYHFAKGMAVFKQGEFSAAAEELKQANLQNMYQKYMLAQAYEKSGNDRAADLLYNEIENYNFNNIGYALIRNDLKKQRTTMVSDKEE